MSEQKQIEAMARADGKPVESVIMGKLYYAKKFDGFYRDTEIPDYFSDNEIDRMVRGLVDDLEQDDGGWTALDRYESILGDMTNYISVATAEQKVEAYLKAKGLWTKEME